MLRKKHKRHSEAVNGGDILSDFRGYKVTLSGKNGNTKRELVICGALEIIGYLRNKIILDMGCVHTEVTGEDLECITYTGGTIEIIGEITKIEIVPPYVNAEKGGRK